MNKNYFWVMVVLLVAVFAVWFLNSDFNQGENIAQDNLEEYHLDEVGLSFKYKTGKDGYVLENQDISNSSNEQLVQSITLTPTNDYKDQKDRIGGEGSPSWSLVVYKNNLNQSPSVWVDTHPQASNIKLAVDEPKESVVSGANAVTYTIDGLYLSKVSVVAHGGFILVVSASYLDESSQTYKEFDGWLDTFTFVPPNKLNGKIDIKVVCEGALAYMTFSSGEEARKFVAECIDGKHPEVIDQYISNFGLDGASI